MDAQNQDEFFVSVDVETAGPNPSQYSLLTIGACTITERPNSFYLELKPVNDKITQEAYNIHRLDLKRLNETGLTPARAMDEFAEWLKSETPEGKKPIFVAFNAAFDWMFVSDYFHRFLGHNPFGHAPLDIKAFYMGLSAVTFADTSMRQVSERYLGNRQLTHHALRDAMDQAEIFMKLLAESRQKRTE